MCDDISNWCSLLQCPHGDVSREAFNKLRYVRPDPDLSKGESCGWEQRLAWRTDSCAECHGPSGEDLSGGYYEAGGSYLKFSFPTAFTITQLAWGVVEHRSGYEKVRSYILL